MSKNRLYGVFIIGIALAGAGCAKKASAPPPGASSTTTEQVMQSNPKVRQQVVDRLKSQIEQSNLSPEEKKRQIDKLMKEGPPK